MDNEIHHPSLLERLENPTPRPVSNNGNSGGGPQRALTQDQDDRNLRDWLSQFGDAQFRITIARTWPEEFEGYNCSGILDHFDELIDDEMLKSRYGGGKFQVKVQRMMPNGRWQYAGARTIKIAGNPVIPLSARRSQEAEIMIPTAPQTDAVRDTLQLARDLTTKAMEDRERAENRVAGSPGLDPTLLTLLTKPLETQISTLNQQIAEKERIIVEKDRIIKELSEKRPDTSFQDGLLSKMFDADSVRVNSLRANFESERRQLIQSHEDQTRRIEERHTDTLKRMEDQHKRELHTLQQSQTSATDSLKNGYESRLEAKDNRIKDLDRDLNKLTIENAELRAKKDRTPLDNLEELAKMREALKMFTGGDEEPEEESIVDKVINAAEPLVRGIGARLENPVPVAPQAQQVRRVIRKVRPAPQAAPTESSVPTKPALPPGLTPEEVSIAVQYMETAIVNNVPPETLAQSVANLIPANIVSTLRVQGADAFLDNVAQLNENSPLSTVVGRNYFRRVVEVLLNGETATAGG